MKPLLLSLLIALGLPAFARAETLFYFGTAETRTVDSDSNAIATSSGMLVIVAYNAASTSANARLVRLTTPSTTKGKAFDYTIFDNVTFSHFILSSPNNVSASYFLFVRPPVGGQPLDSIKANYLAGPNISVRLTTQNSALTRVPSTLSGVLAEITYGGISQGTAVQEIYSLGLLLPQSQYENQNGHDLNAAYTDAANYFNKIGGNFVP